ncbi:MAG: glycogen synthase [Verrucomicrobiales bacterium]|jgi:starch synthase|nr:glycogen synthase [Verrucomicrobiales bacterium]
MLKILFVASECAPYAKAGGLGDVVSGLAKQLTVSGHDARVVLPLYRSIDRQRFGLRYRQNVCVHGAGGRERWAGVWESRLGDALPVWFLDYDEYFGRAGIYDENNREYIDNAYRFDFLSKAALQIGKDLGFIPDVIHVHDWQTSPAAALLKTWDRKFSPLSASASVLTIHNIGYQGVYHKLGFDYLGIGGDWFNANVCEDHGRFNMLKMGIFFADAITTVSPTHAEEILSADGGRGLAPYLNWKRDDVFGIINGADYSQWSPENDRLIPANYDWQRFAGKQDCQRALKERFGLVGNSEPVIGIVSRFAGQKGLYLVRDIIEQALRELPFQWVVIGSGDPALERFFGELPARYPGKAGSYIGYHNELSHWAQAGSDFFLVPSIYEPCGLTQIYAMKYGTLPIVRATGGLRDTVTNYRNTADTDGTGFVFWDATPSALLGTLWWVADTWWNRHDHLARLRQNAMAQNFSWAKPAAEYLNVYAHAIRNRRALLAREG